MDRRARSRQERVGNLLKARRHADLTRAREIFAAFGKNLRDSMARLRSEEDAQLEMLPLADDQKAQRAKDLRAMEARLESLGDEERRELDAIEARYTDVEPYVSAAALVFAITPADAAEWEATR
jgi:predicted  nucleic acid-binding Zn-ribbon protein